MIQILISLSILASPRRGEKYGYKCQYYLGISGQEAMSSLAPLATVTVHLSVSAELFA